MNPEYDPENNSIPGKPSILLREKPWGRTCIYVDAIDMHYIGTYVHSSHLSFVSQIYITIYVFTLLWSFSMIMVIKSIKFYSLKLQNSRLTDANHMR